MLDKRILIAGPCAAESFEQVVSTAEGIALCADAHPNVQTVFRAGIWKPRTSPDTFQGIGSVGLMWLQEVQQRFHLPVSTEVANAEQVFEAAKAGIDYLWIGARTTASPIAVQEIANALMTCPNIQGIFVKNPVNDDAALWMGNIARLEQAGLPVIAIHRGCSHRPCWKMALQLRQDRPDIPLLMDPSHLSGEADRVGSLCQISLELNYDGWMIETHVNPSLALSDAKQQLTPRQLSALLNNLDLSANYDTDNLDLLWYRRMIDEVDDDIWNALVRRQDISRQIGQWKQQHDVPVVQPSRFQEMLQMRKEWAKINGLDSQTVDQIMNAIHNESVRVQS